MAVAKRPIHYKDPRRPEHTLCGIERCEVAPDKLKPIPAVVFVAAPPKLGECGACIRTFVGATFQRWVDENIEEDGLGETKP